MFTSTAGTSAAPSTEPSSAPTSAPSPRTGRTARSSTATSRPGRTRRAALRAAVSLATLCSPAFAALDLSGLGLPFFQAADLPGAGILRLGNALAVGDFNGDGRDDLAVASSGSYVGEHLAAGKVLVYITGVGGVATSVQLLHQDVSGIGEVAEGYDHFGWSLATCDIEGDGYDDLIVGTPDENLIGAADGGVVHVIPGSAAGLITANEVTLTRAMAASPLLPNARFGFSVACGDFDDDGYDDVVVGAPGEGVNDGTGTVAGAGAISFFRGTAAGVDKTSGDWLSRWQLGAHNGIDAPAVDDAFGAALAVGDFDSDGFDDLAIGAPWEEMETSLGGTVVDAGIVHVVFGGVQGLDRTRTDRFSSPFEIPGAGYGAVIVAADLDGDGDDDLVASAPTSDYNFSEVIAAGRVLARPQYEDGLSHSSSWVFTQGSMGETPEDYDRFGSSLAAGDLDGDGADELVIGTPREDLTYTDQGVVVVVNVESPRTWQRLRLGEDGLDPVRQVSSSTYFGTAVAVGNFSGDGPRLAITSPGAQANAGEGIVHFVRHGLFRNGFESGDLSGWN